MDKDAELARKLHAELNSASTRRRQPRQVREQPAKPADSPARKQNRTKYDASDDDGVPSGSGASRSSDDDSTDSSGDSDSSSSESSGAMAPGARPGEKKDPKQDRKGQPPKHGPTPGSKTPKRKSTAKPMRSRTSGDGKAVNKAGRREGAPPSLLHKSQSQPVELSVSRAGTKGAGSGALKRMLLPGSTDGPKRKMVRSSTLPAPMSSKQPTPVSKRPQQAGNDNQKQAARARKPDRRRDAPAPLSAPAKEEPAGGRCDGSPPKAAKARLSSARDGTPAAGAQATPALKTEVGTKPLDEPGNAAALDVVMAGEEAQQAASAFVAKERQTECRITRGHIKCFIGSVGYGVWLRAEHVSSRAALSKALAEFFDEAVPDCGDGAGLSLIFVTRQGPTKLFPAGKGAEQQELLRAFDSSSSVLVELPARQC